MYQIKTVVYKDIDVDPGELVSMLEAAKMLGMTSPGVSSAMARGMLREVVDSDAFKWRGRRFLFREDVAAFALQRKR